MVDKLGPTLAGVEVHHTTAGRMEGSALECMQPTGEFG